MFDVRLRSFTPAGAKGAVLRTLALTSSIQDSGLASLTFTVSERVAGRLVAPFMVAVEFSTGGAYVQPRNGLFIVTEEASESPDGSKTMEFEGVPFVPWQLKGTQQRMNPSIYPGARYLGEKTEWPNATPGRVLRSLIDHAQTVNGWAPMISVDFTATKDSAGVDWTAAERWSPEFPRLTSLSDVLDAHVNAGLVDWWTEGTKLRLFRPGTGTSYPNVKLGGPGFQRMPSRRQYEGQFKFLTVIAEDGVRYYTNPGGDETFGRRDMAATLSGVKLADADRIVAPMLVEGRTPKRELSFEWTPAGALPVPWVDFQVGDGVQARDRDGWSEQRVLGVTVQKTDATVTVRATVGAKLLNRLKRAVSKIEGGSLGQITGGTGATVPVVPPAPSAAPNAPGGLRVASNTATWGEDGTARTAVGFAWDAVTQTTDLADIDGVTYEVWGRLASEASARLTITDALTFSVEGWEPGVARYVKVRARDRMGRVSVFSDEISVTPITPASVVPKAPTGLTELANVAVFQDDGTAVATIYVTWDAVTLSVDGAPVDVQEYEVQFAGYAPVRTTTLSAFAKIPSGRATIVTVRALSTLGVWSDPSASLGLTAAAPAGTLAAPTEPVLTSGVSTVVAAWDGMLTSGAPGPSLAFVYTDVAPDVDGAPGVAKTIGQTLSGAGSSSIRGTMGETLWVRVPGRGHSWQTGRHVQLGVDRRCRNGRRRHHRRVDPGQSRLAIVRG